MNPKAFTVNRLVAYTLAAIVMGLGADGGFSSCGRSDKPTVCQTNSHGERVCPLQTGRQGS